MKFQIPKEVQEVLERLQQRGFSAYIVGGCVRDLFLKREPTDWDVATNAKPEQIIEIFPKSFSDNKFGTIAVFTGSEKPNLKTIEITPFRAESGYSDKRHPDEVKWVEKIEEDLARRDFTINAIALALEKTNKRTFKTKIIDPFAGIEDLKAKIIRAVGNPEERFEEDALRLMRAVRFAITLGEGWQIEEKTRLAIRKKAALLKYISQERIRDELIKIIMSERAAQGIDLLREVNLLQFILPELLEGYGVSQNKHHIFDCYEHALRSLDFAAKKNFSLAVRLAALFHDIAKPRVKKGEGPDATFYNHEIVGAKMTREILWRLKFPVKDIEKITKLVRYHLFYYNVNEVGESSVRRLVRNVGLENMEELLQLRQADRIGSGVPKAEPYKLRHLRYMIEKVSRDPISPKTLKVSGNDVMEILKIKPGPKVGQVLTILLNETIKNPVINQSEILKEKIKELGKLADEELKRLAQAAKKEIETIETKKDQMTKKKYWVT
jgi:tRNA nucleotidyltransferase (CCA-adding enzyme)